MNKLKKYTITSSFGESYMIVGESEDAVWLAAIIAISSKHKAKGEFIRGQSEKSVMEKCRAWVLENIETNARIEQSNNEPNEQS